jgi:hypothetical protein
VAVAVETLEQFQVAVALVVTDVLSQESPLVEV